MRNCKQHTKGPYVHRERERPLCETRDQTTHNKRSWRTVAPAPANRGHRRGGFPSWQSPRALQNRSVSSRSWITSNLRYETQENEKEIDREMEKERETRTFGDRLLGLLDPGLDFLALLLILLHRSACLPATQRHAIRHRNGMSDHTEEVAPQSTNARSTSYLRCFMASRRETLMS